MKCGWLLQKNEKILLLSDIGDTPPTYMESVFGKVDAVENDMEDMEDKQYAPLYQYYQFSNEWTI